MLEIMGKNGGSPTFFHNLGEKLLRDFPDTVAQLNLTPQQWCQIVPRDASSWMRKLSGILPEETYHAILKESAKNNQTLGSLVKEMEVTFEPLALPAEEMPEFSPGKSVIQ